MLKLLYCMLPTIGASVFATKNEKCIEGKKYLMSVLNDKEIAIATEDCCDDFYLSDGVCKETYLSQFHLDPLVVSRFVTAIAILLALCVLVAVVSMLIAYTMFYRRRNKMDEGERLTLAEDLEVESCSSRIQLQ